MEKYSENNPKNDNLRTGLIVAVILLLLGLLGVGYWAYKSNNEKKALAEQNEQMSGQLGDLTKLKDGLLHEVDSLNQAYEKLAQENESLQGSAEEARRRVAEKEAIIKKIKGQSASDNKNLKAQIEELLGVKQSLENTINLLQEENDSLRELTGQLKTDLATSKSENDALAAMNKTIQEELKRLTDENFRASAFRVELEKKSSKATAKSGRARRIIVSFDLMNVKPDYRGVKPLYLVVTDDKGTPIKGSSIAAKVKVGSQMQDIQAVQQKEVKIEESQRLNFNYELEEKLKSGYYRVAVYTDATLLGASSFRLQ